MELDGIKERMTMGIKARLRAGKANAGRDRFVISAVVGTVSRRIEWSRNVIQQILGAAKEYAYGLKTQSRGGETFTIPVPALETGLSNRKSALLRLW
jgi:hypothetical protein